MVRREEEAASPNRAAGIARAASLPSASLIPPALLPSRMPTAAAILLAAGLTAAFGAGAPLPAAPPTTPAAQAAAAQDDDEPAGIPVRDDLTIDSCNRCHAVDDDGMMTRVSYMRKTPEGWQQSIRRMVTLNEVELDPAAARDIVRYLSDHHGIAPEELRPGRFEVERRLIDWSYEADEEVANTCSSCHSMGRVITQRRTREEWELLMAMHRGYYPLSDTQGFLRFGPPGEDGDARHPADKAVDHLSGEFPLETTEWTAWAATMRPPRLAGAWALRGHDPGRGPIFGSVEIAQDGGEGGFTTSARFTYARSGEEVERSGRAIVYTGYQWRGRSFEGGGFEGGAEETALREVMMVERGWNEINGRWFAGAYDEFGPDVTLLRADGPVVLGIHPTALRTGGSATVTVHGVNLPEGLGADDVDLGPGVEVERVVRSDSETLAVVTTVAGDAAPGGRDAFVAGRPVPGAFTVYDQVDRILVTPEAGMARLGGGAFPKGFAQFEATAFSDGPDGEPDTDDDLDLGFVDVAWSVEEYAAVFDDNDIDYVGALDADGLFQPALDGPNPDRDGLRNNVGDVWVVATYSGPGGEVVRGRAHLIVTVPLYMRWEPWRVQVSPTGLPRRTDP